MKMPRWLGGGNVPHDPSGATVQVLRDAAADAQRSRIPQMAAALSYRTIFGLVPIIAIALWVLHKIVAERLNELVTQTIVYLGLDQIFVNQTASAAVLAAASKEQQQFVGPQPEGISAQTVAKVAEATKAAEVAVQQSLTGFVQDIVSRLNGVSFKTIGIVGILMLVYASISMVVEVERAFNQIYRVPRGRSVSRRLTNYWTLLTLGPIGLCATFFVGQQVQAWVVGWTGMGGFGSGATTLTVALFVVQLAISTGVLVLVYLVVPNTKVRFFPALAGAVIAALAFEAGKFGFGRYVEFSASQSYARLYGSLALIPLFLLWVYVNWMIVLFGLQVAYELQFGRTNTRAQPLMDTGPMIVEPAAGLVVMTSAARAFTSGATQTVPEMVKATGLPDPVVRLVVSRLAERGLLHRVERAEEGTEEAYALAKSPAAVRIGDILAIGFEISDAAGGKAVGGPSVNPTLERMRRAQIDAAGSETLAESAGISSDQTIARGAEAVRQGKAAILHGVPAPDLGLTPKPVSEAASSLPAARNR